MGDVRVCDIIAEDLESREAEFVALGCEFTIRTEHVGNTLYWCVETCWPLRAKDYDGSTQAVLFDSGAVVYYSWKLDSGRLVLEYEDPEFMEKLDRALKQPPASRL